MNNKKYKLIRKGIAGVLLTLTLAGCGKNVDCNIEGNHVHLYQNNKNGILKFIEGERELVDGFVWTDEYEELTPRMKAICENGLLLIENNQRYFRRKVHSIPDAKREAHVYDYFYGTFYGNEWGYNILTGKYGYGYALKQGYHYDWRWVNISLDTYTTDQVRDITYMIKLYKVNDEGVVESKLFEKVEEIDEDYIYFNPKNLITECVSEPYYLEKNKTRSKSHE